MAEDNGFVGRRFPLYNTTCSVQLAGYGGAPTPLLDRCEEEARAVRALLDMYDENSALGALNRAHVPGVPAPVPRELFDLLLRVARFSAASGGAYDPTLGPLIRLWSFTAPRPAVPDDTAIAAAMARCGHGRVRYDEAQAAVTFTAPGMGLDVGGVGKGYAADRVAARLRAAGVPSAGINFGGELVLLGPGPSAGRWRVGVQRPWAGRGEILGHLLLQDTAVASSGIYDRYFTAGGRLYHHILDPRTGRPAENDLLAVTITAPGGEVAELLATAFMVLGREEGARLAEAHGAGWLAVTEAGLTLSEGLKDSFVPKGP